LAPIENVRPGLGPKWWAPPPRKLGAFHGPSWVVLAASKAAEGHRRPDGKGCSLAASLGRAEERRLQAGLELEYKSKWLLVVCCSRQAE